MFIKIYIKICWKNIRCLQILGVTKGMTFSEEIKKVYLELKEKNFIQMR
jgi:hypothetical protein